MKSEGLLSSSKHISFFYVLLTVHPNIMIVFFYQLDAQILYFNTDIIFLYMFRAIVLIFRWTIVLVQHLVSSLSLGDCSVHRLREDCKLKQTQYNTHTPNEIVTI